MNANKKMLKIGLLMILLKREAVLEDILVTLKSKQTQI